MSSYETRRKSTLGIFSILVLLAAPWNALAIQQVWEADNSGLMQPGDPEGGDRTFPDTPFDDPNGGMYIVPDVDPRDDEVPDVPVIRLIPILNDYWLIVSPLLKTDTLPYLLTR